MLIVDAKQVETIYAELHKAHRAALPNAVRFTLSDLAFDVKKNTLIQALHKTPMHIKSDSLFKGNSSLKKATGWDIGAMYSQAGLVDTMKAGRTMRRMKQQDEGGQLKHEDIALNNARVGTKEGGRVKKIAYKNKIKVWGQPVKFGDTQGLIKAVTVSKINRGGKGKGNAVIYGKILYEIVGFKQFAKNKIKLHLSKLYSTENNRSVKVKPNHFTDKAANLTGVKTEAIFMENARKQLKKFAR